MRRSRSVTEERGDESRPRDKTQHGARGLLPGPQKQRFLFSSTKWRHVIYGQPASVWSNERHRFMSAIMGCPCYQGRNLKRGGRRVVGGGVVVVAAVKSKTFWESTRRHFLVDCEPVTLWRVGEVLCFIVQLYITSTCRATGRPPRGGV